MALTIDEILDKEFGTLENGYNPEEVDVFLDDIVDELERQQQYIADLEARLKKAEEDLEAAQNKAEEAPAPVQEAPVLPNLGTTLESMFRRAGLVADDTIKEAEEKAGTIVKEAEEKASAILEDAQQERETLLGTLGNLKAAAAEYRNSFLSMLDKHRQALEESTDLFAEEEAE